LILLHPYDSPAQLLSDEVNTRPTRPEKTCARRRDRAPAHKHALRLRTGDLDYPRKKKKKEFRDEGSKSQEVDESAAAAAAAAADERR